MKKSLIIVAVSALTALNVHAADANGGMDMGSMGKGGTQAMSMNEGEVRKVDKAGKLVTLKHGPVKSKSVDMGPMTMTFAVQDAVLLNQVKEGDKVKFQIENIDGQPTVVALTKLGK